MIVTPRSAGLPSRILFFFLVALLLFASYRPAIHLLLLASLALDDCDAPTQMAPVKNLPRPTRQQMRLKVECVARAPKTDVSPGGARRGRVPVERAVPKAALCAVRILTLPDYLRPVEAHLPYNHLSPPV